MSGPSRDPTRPAVLLVHTRYLHPGGEDQAVAADAALLAARGHRVTRHDADNRALLAMGRPAAARAAVWNGDAARDLRAAIARARPDVVHVHNTFPLLSPAILAAARDAGAAVVQTLHNYRLLCPNALLFRDGRVCEDCLPRRVKWPGVAHACYRGSRAASAATAAMLAVHEARGTWRDDVDAFVALSEFARGRFVAGGLPAGRIHVRPNVLGDDPGAGAHGGGFALFVGRLSPEKGVATLLEAWRRVGAGRRLVVVGDGPLAPALDAAPSGVERLGALPHARVLALMRDASFLAFPSECYENCPMTLVEALATGLPVVASRLGATAEMVDDGRTGWLVPPGDADALAAAVERAFGDGDARRAASRAARDRWGAHYSADRAYGRLAAIYGAALAARGAA